MTTPETTATQTTPSFSSKLGFILSTAGSAIGLANIWKFPYVTGKFGGGTFVALYLFFLLFVGLPAFFSEILIGKASQKRPEEAYKAIGKSSVWKYNGKLSIITGFVVSSFYSVVAGWVLGYFFEAIYGNLFMLHTTAQAQEHFHKVLETPVWTVSFHLLFSGICAWALSGGIKKGLERCNAICLPLFFLILVIMMSWSYSLPTASTVLQFLSTVDFSQISTTMLLVALGHAFFTLSVGQGTLITYGSYLKPKTAVLKPSFFVVAADTFVSLATAFCLLSIVFFANADIAFGPRLIFETLPAIFANIPYGNVLISAFFFLLCMAAITSQVSAIEPVIAHVTDTYRFSRKHAVILVSGASFLLGIPSALSDSLFANWKIFDYTFFEVINFIATAVCIPICGLMSVLLVGRKWGIQNALTSLSEEDQNQITQSAVLKRYMTFSITYSAPILIVLLLLHSLGVI